MHLNLISEKQLILLLHVRLTAEITYSASDVLKD